MFVVAMASWFAQPEDYPFSVYWMLLIEAATLGAVIWYPTVARIMLAVVLFLVAGVYVLLAGGYNFGR